MRRLHRPLGRWAWLALLCVALPAAAQVLGETVPLPVEQVAPGVYVHFGAQQDWLPGNAGDIADLGFVVGDRCVAVIDTGGTLEVGRRLRAAVERITRLPVCYVVNTHAHPDHVLGNAAFAALPQRPTFVAHARFAAAQGARERYWLNALQRDFGQAVGHDSIVYPTIAVGIDRTMDLDLGGRTITLQAWPTAHTDNDLTVYDRRTRTLFVSDLLFVGHLPVLDGKLRGWLAVMDALGRIDVATAVPGHGPAGRDWPGIMNAQRRYLDALLRETRAAIKAGATIEQAVDRVGRDAARPWLLADVFHRRNVTAAYAELEWED